jgi:hypothetical protein
MTLMASILIMTLMASILIMTLMASIVLPGSYSHILLDTSPATRNPYTSPATRNPYTSPTCSTQHSPKTRRIKKGEGAVKCIYYRGLVRLKSELFPVFSLKGQFLISRSRGLLGKLFFRGESHTCSLLHPDVWPIWRPESIVWTPMVTRPTDHRWPVLYVRAELILKFWTRWDMLPV